MHTCPTATEPLTTDEEQFFITLTIEMERAMANKGTQPKVTVILKSGRKLKGYVLGTSGTQVFYLCPKKNRYTPHIQIAYSQVATLITY